MRKLTVYDAIFDTEAEANAFIEGVELGSDDSMRCHVPMEDENGRFVVYVHDERTDEGDSCPACNKGVEFQS
jgi:hypothetical protein